MTRLLHPTTSMGNSPTITQFVLITHTNAYSIRVRTHAHITHTSPYSHSIIASCLFRPSHQSPSYNQNQNQKCIYTILTKIVYKVTMTIFRIRGPLLRLAWSGHLLFLILSYYITKTFFSYHKLNIIAWSMSLEGLIGSQHTVTMTAYTLTCTHTSHIIGQPICHVAERRPQHTASSCAAICQYNNVPVLLFNIGAPLLLQCYWFMLRYWCENNYNP